MKKAVLFDLGGTLADYYERVEFPEIVRQGIAAVEAYLSERRNLNVSSDDITRRLKEEDRETDDHRVRPLEERLGTIFRLDSPAKSDAQMMTLCRLFMQPIYARSRRYDDALPVIRELRTMGFKTGIVSNTSWGSPATLWREEIERLGLAQQMDAVIFCRDVGWRKPARQIFEFALKQIGMRAQDCFFVGDHPEWDVAGAEAVGLEAILIDRQSSFLGYGTQRIAGLRELPERLRGGIR
jgi:putative hydrolase of the HAD superfamily